MRLYNIYLGLLRSKRGNVPIIVALLFLPMTVMVGGAVDFVQQERLRVALQNALDRGTLVAASLSQTQEPVSL